MDNLESKEYRNTTTGQDGTKIIEILKNHLSHKSSLLVLGIGSGRDINILSEYYNVTGSDFSKLLLSMFKKNNQNIDVIVIDPADPISERTFDGIYSNKVLHQMDETEFANSLKKQLPLLNSGGIVIHSVWAGAVEENHHGLKWTYYTEEQLTQIVPDGFEIVELSTYKENIDYDSLYVILRKK